MISKIVIFLVKLLELLGNFKTNIANSRKNQPFQNCDFFFVKKLELLWKIKTNIANSRKNERF